MEPVIRMFILRRLYLALLLNDLQMKSILSPYTATFFFYRKQICLFLLPPIPSSLTGLNTDIKLISCENEIPVKDIQLITFI